MKLVPFLPPLSLSLLVGCAGPIITDGQGVTGSTANRSTWDEAGNIESTLQGVYPTNYEVGDGNTGINAQTGGPNHVLGLTLGDVNLASGNPADTTLRGLRVQLSDGSTIEIDELTTLASPVVASWDEQVLASIRASREMAAEQRALFETLYAQTGDVLGSLIKALAPIPTP